MLQCDGDLADDRHGLVDLDRLALALLVDVGERASIYPLAHDDEVRRTGVLGTHDGLGREDVEHGNDAPVVHRGGSTCGRLSSGRTLVLRGDEA